MYCLACQLHFPDHLNYCKHCGRPLSHTLAEGEVEGTRCTRCGARIISGENFCQQCGARSASKSEETSIGTCHNCGVLWRSAWLFCKHCGMARANALVTSIAPPLPSSSTPTVAIKAFQPEVELAEGDAAKPHCPYCAAEVMPNSRFCEACGGKLRTATTGDLNPPPAVDHSSQAAGLSKAATALDTHAPAPAQASPPPPALMSNPPSIIPEASAKIEQLNPAARTDQIEPLREAATANAPELTRPSTLVTQIPAAASASVPARESRQRHIRAAWLTVSLISLGLLLVLAAGLIVWRMLQADSTEVSAPAVTQPSAPPVQETAPPAPGPSVNAAPTPPEGMVYVPGVTFQMGRDDGDEFERPAHAVTVAPFFLDRTEVTNDQYQEFVKQTGHRAPLHWKKGSYPEGTGRLPVVNVSWQDASEYARWAGKRLPTEEEWEFAARGTDSRLYPWGAEWNPNLANTEETSRQRLVEVGSYSAGASPYGALDLCGNVWEWTASDLAKYTTGQPETADIKVIRGGSADTPRDVATATYRGAVQPGKRYDKTGFRCARDIQ
jgi:formylglycine-generating enzyme required for sulfatase activity